MNTKDWMLVLGILSAAWAAFCALIFGYVNSVDWLALKLKGHARRVRGFHRKREEEMTRRWTEEVSGTEERRRWRA
jgi:hypothetical protein